MKTIVHSLLFLALLLGVSTARAEFPVAGGSAYLEQGRDVAVDHDGNLYVAMTFQFTVDFDPGTGSMSGTAQGNPSDATALDVALVKYSPAGALLWVVTFGSSGEDAPRTIRLDDAGNLYVAGYIGGQTSDMDPSTNLFRLNGGVGRNAFLCSYDAAGNFRWARTLGDAESSSADVTLFEEANDLALDSAGNLYVAGIYNGVISLDAANEASLGTNTFLSTERDGWYASYTASGAFRWGGSVGGAGWDEAQAIRPMEGDGFLLAGMFSGGMNLTGGTNSAFVASAGGRDVFFARFGDSRSLEWARSFGGAQDDRLHPGCLLTDGESIWLAGDYNGTVDFDPGTNSAFAMSVGQTDLFVARFAATNGLFAWRAVAGSTGHDSARRLALDANTNVYLTGDIALTVDFEPGPGYRLVSGGGTNDAANLVVAKFNSQGSNVWARAFGAALGGSTNITAGYGIALDAFTNIYVAGRYHGVVDLDPGTGVFWAISNGGSADFLLTRMDPSGSLVRTASRPTLSLTRQGAETRLSWLGGGMLQTAVEVTGAWTDVTNAASPVLTNAASPRQFFRVKR